MSHALIWIHLINFFFANAGVSQNFARKYRIPIDKLGFEYEMTTEETQMTEKPENGAFIYVSLFV